MTIKWRQHVGTARTRFRASLSPFQALSVAVLLLASAAGLNAQTLCATKSSSKVATDRLHYLPTETVQVTGTGFSRSCRVALQVNPRADSATGDVPLTTDAAGGFSYSFVLSPAGGDYAVLVTGKGGALLASVRFTNGATLTTDKKDYHPGETVTMSGSRWLAGETVALVVRESTGVPDRTFFATANAAGDFENRDLHITPADIGARFVVRATGQTSGYTARTTFMDSLAGDCFRTVAGGNWSANGTWESAPTAGGCTVWAGATLTPTSAASTITIRNGHTVHVTAPVTVDEVTVNTGGDVEIDSGVTLTLNRGTGTTDLAVSGTVGVTGTLTQVVGTTGSFVKVLTGGVLTVNSGGLMNGGGGSIAAAPTLTVDSGGTWTIASGGALTSAGTGRTNVTVNGTATLDGAVSMGTNLTVAGTVTASANMTLQTISSLQISGTVTMTAGTLTVTRGNGGTMGSINSGGSLILQGSSVFALGGVAASTLTVASGGTLAMGPSAIVNGASLLAVASGAILRVGSVDGITTGTTNGNVRTTATDTYNAGATYTYDGTAAQVTGNALPASIAGLTINNSTGVTLSLAGDTTVTTTLTLQSGPLNTGANKVILPAAGSVSAPSGWVYGTGAGGLQENVALGSNVARTFPVGTATASKPGSVTFASVTTAGNLIVKATAGDHASIGTSTLNSSKSVGLSWTLTQGAVAVVFTNYSGVFNFIAADLDAGTNTSYLRVGKFNSPNWTYPAVGTQASTSTQATGITSTFGDFQLAEPTPTKLALGQQPTNTTAGSSITPAVTVQIVDANGNPTSSTASVTVAIGTNPGGGTLAGTLTKAAVGGVATFNNLSINKTGTGYTLTAASAGLTGVTSSTFNITAGAAAKVAFGTQPTNTTAGSSIIPAVTVRILDANDNLTASAASLTVAIGTNPGSGTLSGTLTVAAVSGVATFSNLSINKSGTGYTLTAASTGLTGATSSTFNITAGAAAKVAFGTQPTNTTAGSSITPAVTVQILDANDNLTASTASVTVAIGTNPGSGTLSGTLTIAAVSGVATFNNLSINKSGTGYTLTAASGSLTGATSSAFNITAAAANHFLVTAPANATSGSAFTVTVTAQDQYNNTATAYGGTDRFTSSDGLAALPLNYTFLPADNGSHTFTNGFTLSTPGSQTITATDLLAPAITGSATVLVSGSVADFSVTLTDGVTRAFACSALTYTIVVTNNGLILVTGASVTDTFPSDLTGVTWTCAASAGSSCGAASGSGNIAATVTLAAGGTATYSATGTVARSMNGTIADTASVAVPIGVTDPNPANDSATDTDSLNYWVNNATGSDSNTGSLAAPFATIMKAASVIGTSGTVYVQVGNSQSGSPYAANISVSGAGRNGTAGCKTLFLGIPDGSGRAPLVRGTNPTADAGFDVASNDVDIEHFQIENTLVALMAEPSTTRVVFAHNLVKVPDLAYGILLYSSSNSSVEDNRVEAMSGNSFFGIWDYGSSASTLDGNKVSGHGNAGIRSDFSTGLIVQRNITRGNVIGLHMAGASGPATLSNNTADGNSYLGFYAESPGGTVTSRNNIVTNNGVGWAWNGAGTISSNYDDVFGNTSNYSYHGTVGAGASSISANPAFVQTTDATLSTYYQLSAGSPCINAGIDVGLAYSGPAPDIGAVETP